MKTTLKSFMVMLACIGLPARAMATVISYNDFSSTAGLTLGGSAVQQGGNIRLTSLSPTFQAGGVFSNTAVDINNFSASFTFQFSGNSTPFQADGMAFVIRNPGSLSLGSTGGYLGYGGTDKSNSIVNSVAIEFDNYQNPLDPAGDHIGIDTNGSVTSLVTAPVSSAFNGAGTWYAWVDYNGTTLSVSANNTGLKPGTAMLSKNIDIASTIGSSAAYVGFTAATGVWTQNQDLQSFHYNSDPVPEPSTLLLTGIGGVLIIGVSRKKVLFDKLGSISKNI